MQRQAHDGRGTKRIDMSSPTRQMSECGAIDAPCYYARSCLFGPCRTLIRADAYVLVCPHCGHRRSTIGRWRGWGFSSGEGALANGIGSPQRAQSTTKYHFSGSTSLGINGWPLNRPYTSHGSSLSQNSIAPAPPRNEKPRPTWERGPGLS